MIVHRYTDYADTQNQFSRTQTILITVQQSGLNCGSCLNLCNLRNLRILFPADCSLDLNENSPGVEDPHQSKPEQNENNCKG
jgi:hypothetical protein